jgi:hypothetical protein
MKQNTLLDLPSTRVPTGTDRFFDHWNSKENLRHHNDPKAAIYKESQEKIRKLLSGHLFDSRTAVDKKYWRMKFSFPHFQKAVDVFSQQSYYIPSLSRVSLSDFLYNPFADKQKCWFIYCLEKRDKPSQCVDLGIYHALVAAYGKASNQSTKWADYEPYETALFHKAVNLLVEKLKETEKLHDPLLLKTPQDKANLLLNTAKRCAKGDTTKLTISFLSAPWVIKEIPLFMKNQGYLRSPAAFSIYRRL